MSMYTLVAKASYIAQTEMKQGSEVQFHCESQKEDNWNSTNN